MKRLGSADDLRAAIERRKAGSAEPMAFVALQYRWAMASGKGKLEPLDDYRYPDVQTITFEAHLNQQAGLRPL